VVAPADLAFAVLDDPDRGLARAVEEFPVDAVQSHGVDALALKARHQLRAEVAEHHLEHLHRLRVGEAADDARRRLDVLGFDAHPLQGLVDGGRPAVDHCHVLLLFVCERCDVRERTRGVDRASAAYLDDCRHEISLR